jgi:hypothetical protein
LPMVTGVTESRCDEIGPSLSTLTENPNFCHLAPQILLEGCCIKLATKNAFQRPPWKALTTTIVTPDQAVKTEHAGRCWLLKGMHAAPQAVLQPTKVTLRSEHDWTFLQEW